MNGQTLNAGDAIELADVRDVKLDHGRAAEVIVFDLPM